jgi:DNA-binding response OmpR family regulator
MRVFVSCESGDDELVKLALGALANVACVQPKDSDICNATTSDVLVLWDCTADDASAIDEVHNLRSRGQRFPILVVARMWNADSAVRVLDAGADDCLVGDGWRRELRARVCALVRRSSGLWVLEEDGQLQLNRECLVAQIHGCEATLTPTQFAILEYLVRHRDCWRGPEVIIRDVLGTCHKKGTSLVRFHVHKLRNALGGSGSCIRWERGKGYMFTLWASNNRAIADGEHLPLAQPPMSALSGNFSRRQHQAGHLGRPERLG